MPRRSKSDVDKRLDAVAKAASEGRWTTATIRRLAQRFGVTERQIYMDRTRVIDDAKRAMSHRDKADAKIGLLLKSQEVYRRALAKDRLGVAKNVLNFEARIVGAFEPAQISVVHQLEQTDPVDMARKMLNPAALAWARQTLEAAGERVPGVIDVTPTKQIEEK